MGATKRTDWLFRCSPFEGVFISEYIDIRRDWAYFVFVETFPLSKGNAYEHH